ncbi:hypothetical protein AB204_20035 [Xenorhabdus khoisanae]|uniref:Beta protein n=1 Tax=Xenorhabdus khoisanae TaxID=880157 RepID=A0A0J5FM47_9GAMM|nr:beta family protein [Xenorhabdus khoisanae]KMJ43373.1 hypothetical protein AB204_20035 [Xenorhabdus khoisanae]
MNIHHYYPQIRWKAAEYEALKELSPNVISGLTPIISVLDIPWDFINECYQKNLIDHLSSFGAILADSWESERPVFVDVGYLDEHGDMQNHPLDICISHARNHGKELIPVISPGYSKEYIYSVLRNNSNGAAIKVTPKNAGLILYLLTQIKLDAKDVDLIIDFTDIPDLTTKLIEDAIYHYVTVCNLKNWRRIIFSSCHYPQFQTGIQQHTLHTIPREEWSLWQKIVETSGMTRTPGFSDYPTASSEISNIDPRLMSPYVSVRYSDWGNWIIVKGLAARKNGWGQTQNLSQILVNSPYYFDPNYSWGDRYIHDRASNTVTAGSSKTWRKVAHTHHFTMVIEQLSQYSTKYPAMP